MKTYIWIDKQGRFLVVSEKTMHTGHNVLASFTKDLDAASVMCALPPMLDRTPEGLTAVPAWSERKVYIGEKPDMR